MEFFNEIIGQIKNIKPFFLFSFRFSLIFSQSRSVTEGEKD